ncbi:MAG: M20/M25/M40 family metallo-hydrolase [bacterium]
MDKLIERFIELVKIPSPSGKEDEVRNYIEDTVKRWGYKIEKDEIGNLFIETDKQPKFFLNAHMDTVVPCENVNPIIEGDIIHSDGTTILGADDKVGIAVILELLERHKEEQPPIQVIFTVQEEIGLVGAKNIKRGRIKAPFGFTLDAGGPIGNIVIGAPSQYTWRYKVYGVASHAGGAPERGISAIILASRMILSLPLGRIDDETTGNVGIISGGRATNIIPDEVELKGEYRSRNEEKLSNLMEKLRKASAIAEIGGGRAELEYKKEYTRFDLKDNPILEKTVKLLKDAGFLAETMYTGGGSDANIFNEMGIPTLNLSIGGEDAHSTRESTKISEIMATYKVLEILLNIKVEG